MAASPISLHFVAKVSGSESQIIGRAAEHTQLHLLLLTNDMVLGDNLGQPALCCNDARPKIKAPMHVCRTCAYG